MKNKPSKEELEIMYLDDGMNTYEIAKTIGVSNVTISRWLKKYGISMRTISEARLKGAVKPSKMELERMYLDEYMNAYKIGDIVRVSNVTILVWLKEYGIPMRNNSEIHFKNRVVKPSKKELTRMYLEEKMSTYEIGNDVGVSDRMIGVWLKECKIPMRTTSEAMLIRSVKPLEENLRRMYLDECMSTREIGETLNVAAGTIGNWLKEYKIPIRTTSEAMLNADLTGERASGWMGGLSFLPYCKKFNNELKEKIRNRDNRTCQTCGAKENGRKHSVHHIHYDKENCYPDLITVCGICNNKANSNRDEWEIFYMNKLNDRGLLHWTLNNGF